MKKAMEDSTDPSQTITLYIDGFGDWRGTLLTRLRKIILEAEPKLVEEWKWNTPVWSHNGLVVGIGALEDHVKLHFFQGAALQDSHSLFNASLGAKRTRSIDIRDGEALSESRIKETVKAAVAANAKPKVE